MTSAGCDGRAKSKDGYNSVRIYISSYSPDSGELTLGFAPHRDATGKAVVLEYPR